MIRSSFIIVFFSFILSKAIGQEALNDGPYIFIEDQQLVEKSVVEGVAVRKELTDAYDTIFRVQPSIFTGVDKIAALSDIHGQYDLAVEILRNNQIIDAELNWSFGDGHLVIVGDIFDRGDKVTVALWLIYELEQQARAVDGRVHYLLG
ncbi:MAG: metallophosphoesterase, partial [Ekhidna sp.]